MGAAEAGKHRMETLDRETLSARGPFACGGRAYTNEELLAAAEYWGVLQTVGASVTDGLACRAYA